MEGPWGPACEPRLARLQQGVSHGWPHARLELGAVGPRGPGWPLPPTTTCATPELLDGARRAGLGAPREAGPALGCPTRSLVSKRQRGAERPPAPLGKVVAGGFAQHSRALPPAWGSERDPRGLGPPGPGVWASGAAAPGGALGAHQGCLGRVWKAAPCRPPLCTHSSHTRRPCTHPSRGMHAQGNLRVTCEDSTPPGHLPGRGRGEAAPLPAGAAQALRAEDSVSAFSSLCCKLGEVTSPRLQGQDVQGRPAVAAAVTAACALSPSCLSTVPGGRTQSGHGCQEPARLFLWGLGCQSPLPGIHASKFCPV